MTHCWFLEVEQSHYSLAITIDGGRQYELTINADDSRKQIVDKLLELAVLIEVGE